MTSLTPPGFTDLTSDELRFLEQQSLCFRSATPGKCTVSGAFLNSPSPTSGSLSGSSNSSASVRTRNFNTGTLRNFDIPTVAVSVDALEFIGFIPQAANAIFQNYQTRPDPTINPDSLIDYVYGHVSMLNSYRWVALTQREAMSRLGLTPELQDALMDPNFTDIFWTESLHFWVKDTLRVNYATLLQLQQRIKNHARGGRRQPQRPRIQGAFDRPEANLTQTGSQPPQITMTVNMTPKDYHLPAHRIALESEGPLLPDHLVLYKGKAAAEMLASGLIEDDGSINMSALVSYTGGDFNHTKDAWYWSPEKETAEKYRQWAARRSPASETWLIRAQVPNAFINTLRRDQLWFGRDWKEYVWNCKKRRHPPSKFDHLWKDGGADVIRGHICYGVTDTITRIAKEDVQTKITEGHVLMNEVTNRKAIQYVFMQSDSVQRMGEAIRGKIHIEITARIQEDSQS